MDIWYIWYYSVLTVWLSSVCVCLCMETLGPASCCPKALSVSWIRGHRTISSSSQGTGQQPRHTNTWITPVSKRPFGVVSTFLEWTVCVYTTAHTLFTAGYFLRRILYCSAKISPPNVWSLEEALRHSALAVCAAVLRVTQGGPS